MKYSDQDMLTFEYRGARLQRHNTRTQAWRVMPEARTFPSLGAACLRVDELIRNELSKREAVGVEARSLE